MLEDRLDTAQYYDEYAKRYDDIKVGPYHELVHELEFELLRQHRGEGRILECGCGSGLVLDKVFFDEAALGIDISPGMLERARRKGCTVSLASVTELPFPDDIFDLVFSLKTLPHVPDARRALREMSRVAKPGGQIVAEFYNPFSIRGLVRRLRDPLETGPGLTDHDVYYRSDRPRDVRESLLPSSLEITSQRGIRILTPAPIVLEVPVIGGLVRSLERWLADRLPRLGGFYLVVARKADEGPAGRL